MAKTCPTCQKPTQDAFKPFCSKRCADVDLNRWFTGSYAIPAVELDDSNEEDMALAHRQANDDTQH